MDASLIPQSNHGIMDDDDDDDGLGSMSSSIGEDDSASSTDSSLSSDLMEDATSSSSSSSTSPSGPLHEGPLYEMSALFAQLPLKRGLSKHFEGKSQSFTSLSNVRSLEDLAKPERPCKRRLKACKSYGGGLDSHRSLSPSGCSRAITKKASRGSFSTLGAAKRQSFLGSRPPIPPQRSASQTLLFA